MTTSEIDNYSNTFFKTFFDEWATFKHEQDTAGYLHVNNLNTTKFLERMIPLSNLTYVSRHKHPDLRQYTFHKKRTNNYNRAKLDYFLMNEDSLKMVKKVGIGKACPLSDHRPI